MLAERVPDRARAARGEQLARAATGSGRTARTRSAAAGAQPRAQRALEACGVRQVHDRQPRRAGGCGGSRTARRSRRPSRGAMSSVSRAPEASISAGDVVHQLLDRVLARGRRGDPSRRSRAGRAPTRASPLPPAPAAGGATRRRAREAVQAEREAVALAGGETRGSAGRWRRCARADGRVKHGATLADPAPWSPLAAGSSGREAHSGSAADLAAHLRRALPRRAGRPGAPGRADREPGREGLPGATHLCVHRAARRAGRCWSRTRCTRCWRSRSSSPTRVFLILRYRFDSEKNADPGYTTETASLCTFAIGALAQSGELLVATVITIAMVTLLRSKRALHRVADLLSPADMGGADPLPGDHRHRAAAPARLADRPDLRRAAPARRVAHGRADLGSLVRGLRADARARGPGELHRDAACSRGWSRAPRRRSPTRAPAAAWRTRATTSR